MKIKKQLKRLHFTDPYILNPEHPVTVQVIGVGGNGSQVLNQLARIDQALRKLGHVGLHVTCFDDDRVTEANLGRQLFSPADIDQNKAVVLITRLNRFFGTSWMADQRKFTKKLLVNERLANITISCVDNIEARKDIREIVVGSSEHKNEPYRTSKYWMDLGNGKNFGQFVIGSCRKIEQPKKSETLDPVENLQNVFERFPQFATQKSKLTGPSCSLAEALNKQDLFVNSFLVQAAMTTLWKMFREGKIDYHGAFINLKTLDIAKIKL